ncbi:peptidase family C50-domain-containing protein [Lobosporangium transversale]|uniref:separase n=1 Tax=Lobosporangium transversale TaxID=64571 RepID=A0A1Y2GJ21_9FUNG|nr:peptidase family C50-domain-containing protein [Lobosporangium transversale]ORZ11265.1 peptidase family C50-domain-containing protein [Lobosporangium transversale]|eukprot:XP_021879580.1 peptidase family C50-domain-containing protein [Lobosporangium transversale]
MDVEREVNQEHEINIERDVLYVNRMRAGATPLVLRLPLNRGYQREDDHQNLGFETLAQTSSKQHSAATSSVKFAQAPMELTREAKAEWWRQRQRLDERLYTLLCLIQDQWLGGLKGIIQSHNTPVNEENLMNFKRALEWIMSQAVHSMSTASTGAEAGTPDQDESTAASSKDSILQLEINLKDLIYFLLDAYLYNGAVQFGKIALQIKKALCCYWEAETEAKNNGFDDGAHVILILDKHLQIFPWESCPVLREEAVSRVPSIWFLRDRILQQKYCIFKVDPQKTFYILNPGGDLKNTEDEFKEYVESQQGWGGVTGRAPLDLECINGLSKHDLYIYFGHSGGEQYIRSTQIRQLGHCAVSLLLGCSSGCLKGDGEFDPTGNVMNYLLAGCPTIVANLWDVTDKDLDRFSMATFQMWELKSYDDCEPQLSLVEAVKEAREKCKLKYLVGAASVVYGIPCFLKSYGV